MQRKINTTISDDSKKTTLIAVLLFVVALALRYVSLPYTNLDMILAYGNWYDHIQALGFWRGLAGEFSNYTPPYIYLLDLAMFLGRAISKLTVMKLIPVVFDLASALIVYNIVRIKQAQKVALFASMIFLLAPTVIMNGAFWGQIDSLYTTFLLLCIYFILTKRPWWAIAFFGISFSIKAQAVFLAPLLLILTLKRRIPWQAYLLVPPIYFVMMLPAIFAGRPVLDTLLVYLHQAGELHSLSMNAPTWYAFFPKSAYDVVTGPGLALSACLVLIWVYLSVRRNVELTTEWILFLALVSVALVPFFTPKMHDRYFYPADVFSIVLVFYMPDMWRIPIAYQLISLLAYMPFLFFLPAGILLPLAVVINTAALGFLLWKQWVMTKQGVKDISVKNVQ